MNELLNRWRHGEVNLLQRRFRLARAQSVKPTKAAKLLGSRAPTSSSTTATTAPMATSGNMNPEAANLAEDGSDPTASGEHRLDADTKKTADGTALVSMRGGATANDQGEATQLDVETAGSSARTALDKEAFLRVFLDLKVREMVSERCQQHWIFRV